MKNKIIKFWHYYKACYSGEILKRIEYKIKDLTGYFIIRNHFQNKKKAMKMNRKIIINTNNINADNYKSTYNIFNEKKEIAKIKEKLKTEYIFWRKVKLSKYSDIKLEWEYNRLQFLVPIAIEYAKTKNKKYKDLIIELLNYWIENNPYEYTNNWSSNLEIAIRAINIALTLLVLNDEEINEKYMHMLYLHAEHIYSEIEYSNCCIPNNHVIGEAVALLFLSNMIKTKQANKWNKKGLKIITKYLDIIDSDGISKENSFSYQFFVTKMFILSLCFIKNKELFKKVNLKILKSLEILKFVLIDNENIINYGDNDNGFLYSIYSEYNIAKDIKEYYEFFYENKMKDEIDIYLQLFKFYNKENKIEHGKIKNKEYIKTKNIFIYKWKNNIFFFNAKNITGHAHNDSLAVNLFVNGKEILLDSGTYSYNISREKRKYYRNRNSHCTIINNCSNAITVGTFRWLNINKSYLKEIKVTEDNVIVKGVIENLCSREIYINQKENMIKITDFDFEENKIKTNWITPITFNNLKNNNIKIENVSIEFDNKSRIKNKQVFFSKMYLSEEDAMSYEVENNKNNKMETVITIGE